MKTLSSIFLLVFAWEAIAASKILFESDPTLLTTTLQIVVRSGSADEPVTKTGVSSLLADLMLRGTKKKNRAEFQSLLERLGGTLGGHATHDTIEFSGQVIRENTMALLDLVEEFLTEPALSPKEFAALKQEALAGISHMKNVNTRLGGLALRRRVFAGTALERPTNGTLGTVKAISLPDLSARYKEVFHQANFVFAIASPLNRSEIEARVQKIARKFPEGEYKPSPLIDPKIPEKPELIVIDKPGTSTGSILLGQKGIVVKEPDRYHLYVANFSFGGEPLVSRLFNVIRSELGWTYSIGSTYQAMGSLSRQKGLFMVYSTPSVEFTVKSILKIMSMWDSFLDEGVKSDEIRLAQDSLINSYPFNFDSAQKRLGWQVSEELYDIPILSPSEYASTIKGVSNKEIVKKLKEHHSKQGWLISVVADAKTIREQLAREQKSMPKELQLTITDILTPDKVIQ